MAPLDDPFRPSGHTGLLIHILRSRAAHFVHGSGLDIGLGSGILLAALGQLGVARLYGVDIDGAAVAAADRLLRQTGLHGQATLRQGSIWEPFGDQCFDVVTANLPHFPADVPADPEHSPYWSMAGEDGRRWVDPFLSGLAAHLTSDGVAFMTHTTYLGLERTEAVLAAQGLYMQVACAALVPLHPDKAKLINPDVRARYLGTGIAQIGPYEFLEAQILEIRRQHPA